jgi:hypothetical protein
MIPLQECKCIIKITKKNQGMQHLQKRRWESNRLPGEDLDDAVTTSRDDETAVLAPDYAAHTFTAHYAVSSDFLGANALVEGPEANWSVVAGGDGFAAVFAER